MLKVSPSQISASRTCLRKWHGIYVGGEREPDTDATTRGKEIHRILEDYLNGKGPIDTTTHYGRVAASGLKYLPQPRTVITEGDFEMAGRGWVYHGFIDMLKPYYVGDHKTTSDLKYQKTEAELRLDPQVILYGTRSQVHGPGDVEIQWIYYRAEKDRTNSPAKTKNTYKASQTRFVYASADLAQAKASLDHEVSQILGRRHLKMLDLPPTPTACFKYNKPCHLRHYCTDLKPSIGDLMSVTKDALLAELRAKAGGTPTPAGVPVPAPAAAVAPPAGLPPLGPPPSPAPAATAPGLPALPALTPPAAAAPAPATAPAGLPALPALTPPAAAAPAAAPAGLPALPPIDPSILAAAAAEQAAKDAKAAPAAAPAAGLPPLPAPPGPQQMSLPAITPPAPTPAPEPAPSGPLTPGPGGSVIGILFIDCLPVKGETVKPFADIVAECHEFFRKLNGTAHYKLADFGKGLGSFVEIVRTVTEAMGPHRALFVDTSANDQRDALEALIPLADNVVRGIK